MHVGQPVCCSLTFRYTFTEALLTLYLDYTLSIYMKKYSYSSDNRVCVHYRWWECKNEPLQRTFTIDIYFTYIHSLFGRGIAWCLTTTVSNSALLLPTPPTLNPFSKSWFHLYVYVHVVTRIMLYIYPVQYACLCLHSYTIYLFLFFLYLCYIHVCTIYFCFYYLYCIIWLCTCF